MHWPGPCSRPRSPHLWDKGWFVQLRMPAADPYFTVPVKPALQLRIQCRGSYSDRLGQTCTGFIKLGMHEPSTSCRGVRVPDIRRDRHGRVEQVECDLRKAPKSMRWGKVRVWHYFACMSFACKSSWMGMERYCEARLKGVRTMLPEPGSTACNLRTTHNYTQLHTQKLRQKYSIVPTKRKPASLKLITRLPSKAKS